MTVDVHVKDPTNKNRMAIASDGSVSVIIQPHPPIEGEDAHNPRPVRQYMKNSAGASDMRVNGATTNVEFYIEADDDFDTYIKSVSVVIGDAAALLSKFGALAALTNGVLFTHETIDLGTTIIHDALKTNFNFIRLSLGNPSFGDGVNAFLAGKVAGTSEAYLPVINFTDIFGLPWGLRLRKGTKDRLVFTVRDNITAIDQFDAIAYGLKL